MKKNKTLKYLLILAAILIVVALIGKKAGWFGKGPLTKVAVESVQKRTIVETITANGRIQPETEVKIRSSNWMSRKVTPLKKMFCC